MRVRVRARLEVLTPSALLVRVVAVERGCAHELSVVEHGSIPRKGRVTRWRHQLAMLWIRVVVLLLLLLMMLRVLLLLLVVVVLLLL